MSRRIPGLDPAVQELAGLTDKQPGALALWVPGWEISWSEVFRRRH